MKKIAATLAAIASATLFTGALALVSASKADAAPRAGLRAAQYELCDAGHYYRQDVANGYMNRKQAIREAALYAVDLQRENGWGPETNTALAAAADHGYRGGNCNIYR